MQRFIKIDGKVRTDITYPTGFMGKFCYNSVWFSSLKFYISGLLWTY